jgi:hypothetical protein
MPIGATNAQIPGVNLACATIVSIRSIRGTVVLCSGPLLHSMVSMEDVNKGLKHMILKSELRNLESGSRLKWTRLTPPVNICIGILEHDATPEGHSVVNWPDGTTTDTTDRQAMRFVGMS